MREDIPAALRREVRLLGTILGQVLVESAGPELLEDVERLRKATIAFRGVPNQRRRRIVTDIVDGFDPDRAEQVARAFTVYFQLVNLAEEHQRVRTLRERARGGERIRHSLEEVVGQIRDEAGEEELRDLLQRLEITAVLTAHPTEARRRAVVETIRRIAEQLERMDDPRISPAERSDVQRALFEEITSLWHTDQLRLRRPDPLDEVRAAMWLFDQTIFQLVPSVYRELDRALDADTVGVRPPTFRPFLRWGSWIGGDRDGNPNVTAAITREVLDIHADHVLRGLEAATRRIGRELSASQRDAPPSAELLASLDEDARTHVRAARELMRNLPDAPHRRKLVLMAEAIAATRTGRPGGFASAEDFLREIGIVQRSLADAGAARLAYGELQNLAWQVETFGFHLASLEVREHADVLSRAIGELAPHAQANPDQLDRLASDGWPHDLPEISPTAQEVLETLRAMRELQGRFGAGACHRYVVSFTRSAADVLAVHAFARLAVPDGSLSLDVVPLFESRADLEAAPDVLDDLLARPGFAAWLERRGRRLEVMLGYSDSAKDVGFLAANLALYRAQRDLAAWARKNDVALRLFHGRGGALGRGGGPAGRAIRGQAPGSVDARFKVTEQGEVAFDRYGNRRVAQRHIEQMTSAVLAVSAPKAAGEPGIEGRFDEAAKLMGEASELAWRALVEREGFAPFFARVTPNEELDELAIGSRPTRRREGADLGSLRAIPWVFAWSQTRCNLPGWYGLGSGLAAVAERPRGLDELRRMFEGWPFFTSLLENAQLSLLKADMPIAELYLALGENPELSDAIRSEYERTVDLVLRVTEQEHLLEPRVVLRRAIELRNAYVDALSFLQVRFLRELREGIDEPERTERVRRLVLVTIHGVAAGLQNTG